MKLVRLGAVVVGEPQRFVDTQSTTETQNLD